jgi:hypothetical protein
LLQTAYGFFSLKRRAKMLTDKRGEAAAWDIAEWARGVASALDTSIAIDVRDDHPDSNTYLIRLEKNARVLLFRLSYAPATAAKPNASAPSGARSKTLKI